MKYLALIRTGIGRAVIGIFLILFMGIFIFLDKKSKENEEQNDIQKQKANIEKAQLERSINDATVSGFLKDNKPKIPNVSDDQVGEDLMAKVNRESEEGYERDPMFKHEVRYKEPEVRVREVIKYVGGGSEKTVTREKKVIRVRQADGSFVEKEVKEEKEVVTFPSFMVHSAVKEEKEEVKKSLPPVLAPYGRIIKCELVNTVDSIADNSPIIGMTMEDLFYNGELIIPAGSEVHGWSTNTAKNQHVLSQDAWKVVLGSDKNRDRVEGETLNISAMALHRGDKDGAGKTFSLNDMSPGLFGYTIESGKLQEIKMWLATFVSGMATGFQDRETNPLSGSVQIQGTARNAIMQANAQLFNEIATDIREEIAKNGYYTRVYPASQFYLYVTESIRIDDAQWNLSKEEDTIPNEKQVEEEANPFGIPGFPSIPGLGMDPQPMKKL